MLKAQLPATTSQGLRTPVSKRLSSQKPPEEMLDRSPRGTEMLPSDGDSMPIVSPDIETILPLISSPLFR